MAYANKFPIFMNKGGTKKYAKGGIMKTAGKTTTGVISDYRGYKGPKSQTPMAKLKKLKNNGKR